MEINNFPEEKFKVTVIRMHTKLGNEIEALTENFNKELQSIINTKQN